MTKIASDMFLALIDMKDKKSGNDQVVVYDEHNATWFYHGNPIMRVHEGLLQFKPYDSFSTFSRLNQAVPAHRFRCEMLCRGKLLDGDEWYPEDVHVTLQDIEDYLEDPYCDPQVLKVMVYEITENDDELSQKVLSMVTEKYPRHSFKVKYAPMY